MTAAGVLIVGYGNPLRSDDGIGWHAAGLLATDPRLDGARVLARHQLAPELAEDVSRASLVVLVDAAADGDPGSVSVRQIGSPPPTPITWSHHLDPGDPGRAGRGPLRRRPPDRPGERRRRTRSPKATASPAP